MDSGKRWGLRLLSSHLLFTGRETEAGDRPGPPVSSHSGRVSPSALGTEPLGTSDWEPSHTGGEQMAAMQLYIPQFPLPGGCCPQHLSAGEAQKFPGEGPPALPLGPVLGSPSCSRVAPK